MKVKDLIEKLQRYDPETMVVVNGYEGGVDTCTSCKEVRVMFNINKEWYYGNHELVNEDESPDKAILIG